MSLSFFHLTKNIILSNYTTLSSPYKLTFAVTYHCNSRCRTCNIWQKKSANELTLEEINTFVKNNNFSWINLTGGEPFLRDDLVEIIHSIVSQNRNLYFLNFTSNGFLVEKILEKTKRILQFLDIPKFAIGISLEGLPDLDNKIRGISKSYDLSLQSFKNLKELFQDTRWQTFISYTISPENIGRLQETMLGIQKDIPGFLATEFHINLFHLSSHYYGNNNYDLNKGFFTQAGQEIKNYLNNYKPPLKPDTWLEKKFLNLQLSFLKNKKIPLPCQALKTSCFINPSGDVYPCSMYDKKIGNIRETSYQLSPIWNSKEAEETRKIIADYKCPSCWTACEAYQTILGNLYWLKPVA